MSRLRASPPRLGAWIDGDRTHVRAWAPEHQRLEWVLYEPDGATVRHLLEMSSEPGGYFHASTERDSALLYKIRIDGHGPFPDPWSRAQPFGVHGPSALDAAPFEWSDAGWRGLPLEALVVYELHVGTATPAGTFEGLIPRLPELREDGITALELMPVASFPGRWNWGYDGVSWFAPAEVYGGPSGLRALVDAAHRAGIAVLLDVVYNHFGPDGNYLACYSKSYFTSRDTKWGEGINYSGEGSQIVRELALRNAEMWIRDYHLDGLRLDAVHAIHDESSPHLVQEIVTRAKAAAPDRQVIVIAEDGTNDARLITAVEQGGFGVDAVWADDFHHELRRAFAGDSEGYFRPYRGTAAEIVETLEEGWFLRGEQLDENGEPKGTRVAHLPPERLVHCLQNHDQVGNRPFGNRLGDDVSPAELRAMTALLLLSPYTPLLFAGQEWGTRAPFLFFTDHHPELGKKVTEGRRSEFAEFAAFQHREVPDPQAEETFRRSCLDWTERTRPGHRERLALHRCLLRLRRTEPALAERNRGSYRATLLGPEAFVLERRSGPSLLKLYFNLRGAFRHATGPAELLLDSEDARFGGSGCVAQTDPLSFEGPRAVLLRVALP